MRRNMKMWNFCVPVYVTDQKKKIFIEIYCIDMIKAKRVVKFIRPWQTKFFSFDVFSKFSG